MGQWFVAKTKPRGEIATAAVLGQRGIEVFLPFVPSVPGSTSRAATREALFPGYLFVRIDHDSSEWLGVRSAPGIAYFLGAGGQPSALPDELVEGIRLRTRPGRDERPRSLYAPGDAVTITEGPFAGLDAMFDRCLTARGRVRVLLELLQRLVPVEVDERHLARAI